MALLLEAATEFQIDVAILFLAVIAFMSVVISERLAEIKKLLEKRQ